MTPVQIIAAMSFASFSELGLSAAPAASPMHSGLYKLYYMCVYIRDIHYPSYPILLHPTQSYPILPHPTQPYPPAQLCLPLQARRWWLVSFLDVVIFVHVPRCADTSQHRTRGCNARWRQPRPQIIVPGAADVGQRHRDQQLQRRDPGEHPSRWHPFGLHFLSI